jgi:PAS domain S-box-containing protein
MLLFKYSSSQEITQRFQHLQSSNLKIYNSVTSIQQDKFGMIWIGTQNKLFIYDGNKFKIFKKVDNDSLSISNNYIESIYKDQNGDMWIGTKTGFDKYSYENENFIRHGKLFNTFLSVKEIRVHDISEDSEGKMWIGISNFGLIKYDPINKTLFETPISDQRISINAILKDNHDNLILATTTGVIIYNVKTKKFESIYFEKENPNSANINNIKSICLYNEQILLIGSWRGGLIKYNLKTKNYIRYTHTDKIGSISDNQVESIVKDNEGNVWIATWNQGLNKIDKKYISKNTNNQNIFETFKKNEFDINSIISNTLWPLFLDNQNNLWIGTANGINFLNLIPKQFFTYKDPVQPDKLNLNVNDILCIKAGSKGDLLFGTRRGLKIIDKRTGYSKTILFSNITKNPFNDNIEDIEETFENKDRIIWLATIGGLIKYNESKNKIKLFINTEDPNSISHNIIYEIVKDKTGDLWLASARGLNLFNPETEQNKRFLSDPQNSNSLSHNSIWAMALSGDSLYIGTANGLNLFNPKTNNFQHFFSEEGNINSLTNNSILSIKVARNKDIWIGTFSGLNKIDHNTKEIERISHIPKIKDITISNIAEDNNSHLWISSESGLIKYTLRNDSINIYDEKDGLPSNIIYNNSVYEDSDGKIYFGTNKGAFSFYPDSIKHNKFIPPVILTDLKIFNNSVKINKEYNGSIVLSKSLLVTKEINLTHKHKIISFDFSSLSYNSPEDNQYAYMMDEFEENWNYIGTRKFATYTNLPAGSYTFKVKASNNDGVWNENYTELVINVKPPWWKTILFYAFCFCIFILSTYLFIRIREKKSKLHKILLERIIKERTKDLYESNTQLEEKQTDLETKQEEIAAQRDAIENQNKELEKLSIVASKTDNAITIMDAKGNFEWFNDSYIKLHGYKLNEFIIEIGENIITASKNKEIRNIINSCIKNKETINYESENISKSGNRIWTQVTITPILDKNKNILKLISIESDIGKLKEYEKEVLFKNEELASQRDSIEEQNKELEKHRNQLDLLVKERTIELETAMKKAEESDRLKSAFLTNMSHEIRTPMNAIIGFSNLLNEPELEGTTKQELMALINHHSNSLLNLIDDILDIARIEANQLNIKKKNYNLHDQLNILHETYIEKIKQLEKKDIELRLDFEINEKVFTINSDQLRIQQIFTNLLDNAIKFTEKGLIEFGYTLDENIKKPLIKFHVKDTGIGLPDKQKNIIFERFRKAENNTGKMFRGTGLGLAISKNLTELLGGEIWVESRKGAGSTFYFTVPLIVNK